MESDYLSQGPGQATSTLALPGLCHTDFVQSVSTIVAWRKGVGWESGGPPGGQRWSVLPQGAASPTWLPGLGVATLQFCGIGHWHRCLALRLCLPASSSRPGPSSPPFFLQRDKLTFCHFLKLACLISHCFVGILPVFWPLILCWWKVLWILSPDSQLNFSPWDPSYRSFSLRMQHAKVYGLAPKISRKSCGPRL